MELVKDLWGIFVIAFAISYFGGLVGITYKLGLSALDLHQKGMFSLGKLNRSLVGTQSVSTVHNSQLNRDFRISAK